MDGRYEVNDAERHRSRYVRWTGETAVRLPLSNRTELTMGIRYRVRTYGERLVELDGVDVPRLGHRWEPEVSLSYRLPGDLAELQLEYEFERRNESNEIEKGYRSHRTELMVRRRF